MKRIELPRNRHQQWTPVTTARGSGSEALKIRLQLSTCNKSVRQAVMGLFAEPGSAIPFSKESPPLPPASDPLAQPEINSVD